MRQKIRLLEQKRKRVRFQNPETEPSEGKTYGSVKAIFIPEKFPNSFRGDPNIFGRFEFPLGIEGEITKPCELDTGSAGSFVSNNIFNKLSEETRSMIPRIKDELPYEDFGHHGIETEGAVSLVLYMGDTSFAHKFHLLKEDDVFLLGSDAVKSKKIGWYWPADQEDETYSPYCIVTLGLANNILGKQVVRFDQDIRHPVFSTRVMGTFTL